MVSPIATPAVGVFPSTQWCRYQAYVCTQIHMMSLVPRIDRSLSPIYSSWYSFTGWPSCSRRAPLPLLPLLALALAVVEDITCPTEEGECACVWAYQLTYQPLLLTGRSTVPLSCSVEAVSADQTPSHLRPPSWPSCPPLIIVLPQPWGVAIGDTASDGP